MTGLRANGSAPSLPVPRPKSPPEYADLYGKRREMAKVQVLEREIGFLEEELKSVEGLQPASRPCKELADFVMCNADPLIPVTKKIRRSCCLWKWLCGASCFNVSSICCCCCQSHPESARSRDCTTCSCSSPCGAARRLNATIASAATADALTSLRAAGIAVYPSVLPA
ncbi:UNVERIFIED_CONTAM: Guanine nucleotide-binding protein subunit gamma 3 [Sesamum calycinum]|uniref:Guanine nucleotide-binding protein subunit gamma 3 n=1 Tax=Sesamum calycinum TaxID=2727403 RepID=A0AAW2NVY2_9LAMI